MWIAIADLVNRYIFNYSVSQASPMTWILYQGFTAILSLLVIALPVIVFVKIVRFICE